MVNLCDLLREEFNSKDQQRRMKMNVLSLFDGISAGMVALKRVGIKVDNYYASEIDKYAMAISKHNHPEIIHIGDITKIRYDNGVLYTPLVNIKTKIDIIIGGSPCTGFSFAGKQLNFDDPQSKLYFEYLRLLREISPKYFLLENVKMKTEYSDVITNDLGVDFLEINSRLLSAQNRPRLYFTNIPNVMQPIDRNYVFKDIMDSEHRRCSEIYQERYKQLKPDNGNNMVVGTCKVRPESIGQREVVYGLNNKIGCLTATDYKQPKRIKLEDGVYLVSPIECERLQTFPDNYTKFGDFGGHDEFGIIKCISNTQRYKSIGNSWTVDVISHILQGIESENQYEV